MAHKKKRSKRRKLLKIITVIIAAILIVVIAIYSFRLGRLYLAYKGKITPPPIDTSEYEVHGIDISHYQGDIDWEKIKNQGIDFAFIKATEGEDYLDDTFQNNWEKAKKAGVFVGAYHYYNFNSDGEKQAKQFIKTVPKDENCLPPVVDFELTDEDTSIDTAYTKENLKKLLNSLKAEYGQTPILYTTPGAYLKYLIFGYSNYTMWIRDTYYTPVINWTFWQYDDEGQLNGYSGDQTYIDLDVYNGSYKKFLKEFNLKGVS